MLRWVLCRHTYSLSVWLSLWCQSGKFPQMLNNKIVWILEKPKCTSYCFQHVSQLLFLVLRQYTNQMAHFHLIYTIFSSQTVLIQQYKLIHVNFLLPKTYSSLFSSFLSLVGSPHGPPSLCPDSAPSELFHLSPVSSLLSTEALVGGLQSLGLAPPLFQNISLSWCSCKKTVCWNRITHMYRCPDP